jgi:hypothetical protein
VAPVHPQVCLNRFEVLQRRAQVIDDFLPHRFWIREVGAVLRALAPPSLNRDAPAGYNRVALHLVLGGST